MISISLFRFRNLIKDVFFSPAGYKREDTGDRKCRYYDQLNNSQQICL